MVIIKKVSAILIFFVALVLFTGCLNATGNVQPQSESGEENYEQVTPREEVVTTTEKIVEISTTTVVLTTSTRATSSTDNTATTTATTTLAEQDERAPISNSPVCRLDSDCVPKQECHPRACMPVSEFKPGLSEGMICTMLYDYQAAYFASDCACDLGTCINKNLNRLTDI